MKDNLSLCKMEKKILLGIPIYNDLMTEWLPSLMGINDEYKDNVVIKVYGKDGLISRVRNRMFSDFYNDKTFSHLITIDDDCVFNMKHFNMLMEHINNDLDIVVGAVPTKADDNYLVIRLKKPQTIHKKHPNLIELDSIGDFQLLSRKCADKMVKKFPELKYKENKTNETRYAMFMPMLKDDEYLDETWSYSLRAREAGCKLWFDRRIIMGHKGEKVFIWKPK